MQAIPLPSPVIAYIALGSNLGARRGHIDAALAALAALPGTRLDAISSRYETSPIGPGIQRDYINAVARVVTQLPPLELLDALLTIEGARGRLRTERWGPRTLDLDLLLYGTIELQHPRLTLPHPAMLTRAFVLVPIHDLAPDLVVAGRSIAQHLAGLEQSGIRCLAE